MFDLSQITEGLRDAVPPVDHIRFTFIELTVIDQILRDAEEKYPNDETVHALLEKLYTYEFH